MFLRTILLKRGALKSPVRRLIATASSVKRNLKDRQVLLGNLEDLQKRCKEEEEGGGGLAREFYETGLEACIAAAIRKGDHEVAKTMLLDAVAPFPPNDLDHRVATYLVYEMLEAPGREPLQEAITFLSQYLLAGPPSEESTVPAACFKQLLTRAQNESDPWSADRLLELCAQGKCRDPQSIVTPEAIESVISMVYLRNHCWNRIGEWIACLSLKTPPFCTAAEGPSHALLVEIFEVALQRPQHASCEVFIGGKQEGADALNFAHLQTILADWHNRGVLIGRSIAYALETLSERVLFPADFLAFLEATLPSGDKDTLTVVASEKTEASETPELAVETQ